MHTPGPWAIISDLPGAVSRVYGPPETNGGWAVARIDHLGDSIANALLIASAPDLLSALEAIIGDKPDKYGYSAAFNAMDDAKREAARAAIAKAKVTT